MTMVVMMMAMTPRLVLFLGLLGGVLVVMMTRVVMMLLVLQGLHEVEPAHLVPHRHLRSGRLRLRLAVGLLGGEHLNALVPEVVHSETLLVVLRQVSLGFAPATAGWDDEERFGMYD